jgi:hypothetical protein
MVRQGSAVGRVKVTSWKEDDAIVYCHAIVVTGAEINADLTEYLLRKNSNMRFGAFTLDDDNDIIFEHSIVGSTCDKNELRTSILAVIQTADELDDEIVSRWGGQRGLD